MWYDPKTKDANIIIDTLPNLLLIAKALKFTLVLRIYLIVDVEYFVTRDKARKGARWACG